MLQLDLFTPPSPMDLVVSQLNDIVLAEDEREGSERLTRSLYRLAKCVRKTTLIACYGSPSLPKEDQSEVCILDSSDDDTTIEDDGMHTNDDQKAGEKDGENGVSPLTRPSIERTAAYLLGYTIGADRRSAKHIAACNEVFVSDRMFAGERRHVGRAEY